MTFIQFCALLTLLRSLTFQNCARLSRNRTEGVLMSGGDRTGGLMWNSLLWLLQVLSTHSTSCPQFISSSLTSPLALSPTAEGPHPPLFPIPGAVGASSASSSNDGVMWSCQYCTLQNPSHATLCEACNLPRSWCNPVVELCVWGRTSHSLPVW